MRLWKTSAPPCFVVAYLYAPLVLKKIAIVACGVVGLVVVVEGILWAYAGVDFLRDAAHDYARLGAAGAWASALGATALAIASVWLAVQANGQAKKAEDNAKTEAEKAEQRHKDAIDAAEKRLDSQLAATTAQHEREIAAAEMRLSSELDAQRRYQQLMAISPMWTELVKLSTVYGEVVPVAEQYAIDRDRILKSGRALTDADMTPIFNAMTRWTNATNDFDVSCSNALMMVTEESTADLISKFYVEFRLIQKEVLEHLGVAITGDTLDVQTNQKGLDDRMKGIRLKRRAVIRDARERIVGAKWLDLSANVMNPFET